MTENCTLYRLKTQEHTLTQKDQRSHTNDQRWYGTQVATCCRTELNTKLIKNIKNMYSIFLLQTDANGKPFWSHFSNCDAAKFWYFQIIQNFQMNCSRYRLFYIELYTEKQKERLWAEFGQYQFQLGWCSFISSIKMFSSLHWIEYRQWCIKLAIGNDVLNYPVNVICPLRTETMLQSSITPN